MVTQTFERFEKKFLITKEQKKEFLNKTKDVIKLDDYSKDNGYYNIYSIYIDDKCSSIIRESVSKPPYKEKLRIRSYKLNPSDDDLVFLEIKKKYNGVGNKRRIKLSYKDCMDFVLRKKRKVFNDYLSDEISQEICSFLDRGKYFPAVFISCLRQAYVGIIDDDLRITFDEGIKVRQTEVNLLKDEGTELLDDDLCIMEIKVKRAFPMYLVNILSEMQIYTQPFSKYGKAYQLQIKRR